MAPKAVIVGVGRSGSGYTAAMLNAAGIDCGHEAWWHPLERSTDERVDHLVDSSWCALPDLLGSNYTGTIVVQHRHPVAIATSLAFVPDWGPYRRMRSGLVPLSPHGNDRVADAVETVERWTRAMMRLPHDAVWYLDGPSGPPGAAEAWWLARRLGVDWNEPGPVGVVNPHHDGQQLDLSAEHEDRLLALAAEIGY